MKKENTSIDVYCHGCLKHVTLKYDSWKDDLICLGWKSKITEYSEIFFCSDECLHSKRSYFLDSRLNTNQHINDVYKQIYIFIFMTIIIIIAVLLANN